MNISTVNNACYVFADTFSFKRNEYFKVLVSAILAGIFISIGATVNLSLDNKIAGAIFFSVGLLMIVCLNVNLFTGNVWKIFEDYSMWWKLPVIWLGNYAGCTITALLLSSTRFAALSFKAGELCYVKITDSFMSLFFLGAFCNILIYFAIIGFQKFNDFRGMIALVFGVSVFVLCGFEHCVADMFYFTFAGYGLSALPYILVVTAGNLYGGASIHYIMLNLEE